MKLLFIGESWLGSCARSMREALARRADVELDEINEEAFLPNHKAKWLRGVHRLLGPQYRRELANAIVSRVQRLQPNVVMAYKGNPIDAELLRSIKHALPSAITINVYPDYSPHAYGAPHREAVGEYDLVISTKPYHRDIWTTTYGYQNECRFVPQGYDPALHLVDQPPARAELDIAMVATWRPEYHRLMVGLARELGQSAITVGIGGNGWPAHAGDLPTHWQLPGELTGQSYIQFLRSGRICIAPLNREVNINGHVQPGDVDTTRSYELAAAHCFFIHQRTPYIQTVYDEETEVPMFDDANELAAHVRHFIDQPQRRAEFAARAHARAVPAYSLDARAAEIARIIAEKLGQQA
jgi:hypothetical protein